jgi:hypothetical protein
MQILILKQLLNFSLAAWLIFCRLPFTSIISKVVIASCAACSISKASPHYRENY